MTKTQILDLIVADFRGKLARCLPDDIKLTEQGEHDLHESVYRQYMNHPSVSSVQEWVNTISHCQQLVSQ